MDFAAELAELLAAEPSFETLARCAHLYFALDRPFKSLLTATEALSCDAALDPAASDVVTELRGLRATVVLSMERHDEAYYEEDVEHTAYLRQLVDDLRAQPTCNQQDLEFAQLLLARD